MDPGTAREEPLPRRRQPEVPHPAIDRDPQRRFTPPRHHAPPYALVESLCQTASKSLTETLSTAFGDRVDVVFTIDHETKHVAAGVEGEKLGEWLDRRLHDGPVSQVSVN